MARTKTTSKGAKGTKGKTRNKDLEKIDEKKVDADRAIDKKIEQIINDIISRLKHSGAFGAYKDFFIKMVDDIKNGDTEGFVLSDFSMLVNFCTPEKSKKETVSAFTSYFISICDYAEQEAKQKDEQEIINDYENFLKAINLLSIAVPMKTPVSFDEFKKEEENKIKHYVEGKEYYYSDKDFEALERGAYYIEFLKRAKRYFNQNIVILHYLDSKDRLQELKDGFRRRLNYLDEYFNTKSVAAIRDGKLTQNVCNYVIKNFADFFRNGIEDGKYHPL